MRHKDHTRHRRTPGYRSARLILSGVAALGLVLSALTVTQSSRTEAADLTQFRPGNIISDAVFYDTGTMGPAQIQAFLDRQLASCASGHTCLKSYRESTTTRPADAYCRGYQGQANESSADIIYKTAQSCGVNPQVILVMLQKEQGLVTKSNPTATTYQKAMGMGCPDTAACDSKYYGFANQVYSGIRQLRVYEVNAGSYRHRARTTVNVLFHPNSACGSSPVYLENQATAGLYNYTPYQPNAASLAAGRGTGDGCSSYGNRNFYTYFTDWFGSTQGGAIRLVRGSSASVYLIDGIRRWYVPSYADYEELLKAFGPLYSVGDVFVNKLQDAGPTSVFVRNNTSGAVSMVQDGQLHRFTSCEVLAQWGGSCSVITNADPAMFAGVPTGGEMSPHFRVAGTTTWGTFTGPSQVQPYWNEVALRALQTVPAWVGRLPAARYQSMSRLPQQFAPATLIKDRAAAQVYLTDGTSTLLPVTDFGLSADLGRPSSGLLSVAAADLAGYQPATTALGPALRCGTATYVAAGGTLHRLADPARAGLTPLALNEATCRQLNLNGTTVAEALLVKSSSSPTVYVVEAGTRRTVASWADAQRLGGSSSPLVLVLSTAGIAAIPEGGPTLVDGTLVKAPGAPEVYVVSGRDLARIPSFELAAEWGIPRQLTEVPAAEVTSRNRVADLGLWGRCGAETVFAASGRVVAVTTPAGVAGFPTTTWSSAACAGWTRGQPVSRVFVKSASDPTVYAADNNTYRPVASWDALVRFAGGQAPAIQTISPVVLATLPRGPAVS